MTRSRFPVVVEVLTGVSIVASLVLVAMEIRGNTKAIERQIRVERAQSVTQPILDSEPLLEAYRIIKTRDGLEPEISAFVDTYGLSREQAIAWTRFLYRAWLEREADFDYMGPDPELAASVAGLLVFPDNRLFWETAGHVFSPEFSAFVAQVRSSLPEGDIDPE